jgi:hypothetical protein
MRNVGRFCVWGVGNPETSDVVTVVAQVLIEPKVHTTSLVFEFAGCWRLVLF